MDAMVKPDPQDKLIVGAKNIGEFLGLTERQAFHRLSSGKLPGDKLGDQWVSTANRLNGYMASIGQGEATSARTKTAA